MDSVEGKVVLITGSSSGIGAVTALLFAQHSSRLVLTGRNQERLDAVVERCVSAGLTRDKILAVTAEVTVDADLDKLVESAIAKFGTIDVLVNNAAIVITGSAQQQSMDDLDLTYRTNLRAPIYLIKLAIPYLKKSKGCIVNVSSLGAVVPNSANCAYHVLKAGLDMMSKNFALELAPDGIRVNTVRPGCISTPMHSMYLNVPEDSKELTEYYNAVGKLTPLQCIGTGEEIAQSILFLVSDASSFTTRAFLDVDGGFSQTSSWTNH